MSKAPAFQLYVNDALRDTRVLSLEARGAWWDCLLMMWNAPTRGVLEHTYEQFARLFGTDLGTAERVISEIESTGVADVERSSNGDVTLVRITCRRMSKDQETREKTRLRVQKHRSNGGKSPPVTQKKHGGNDHVTPPSSSSTSSSVHTSKARDDLGDRVRRLLSFFNIDSPIERIGPEAQRIFADPATAGFLDDEGLETIERKAPAWLAQTWIKDVNPRFIAERLADIYNFQPKEELAHAGADKYAEGF